MMLVAVMIICLFSLMMYLDWQFCQVKTVLAFILTPWHKAQDLSREAIYQLCDFGHVTS